jgi:hypothetical protein
MCPVYVGERVDDNNLNFPTMKNNKDEIVEIAHDTSDDQNATSMTGLIPSLIALMSNITSDTSSWFDQWRPPCLTGQIEGIADGLTCIMTNGLLGYFLRHEGGTLYGHVTHFKWVTAVESMIPYYNEKGEKKYFKSIKDQGAPSALHCLAKDATISEEEVKKSRPKGKSKRQFY